MYLCSSNSLLTYLLAYNTPKARGTFQWRSRLVFSLLSDGAEQANFIDAHFPPSLRGAVVKYVQHQDEGLIPY